MQWRGRRQSSNIEDRRGQGGGFGRGGGFGMPGGMGGRGPRIGLPTGGRGGGIGIVGLIVLVGVMWFAGIDPLALLQGSGVPVSVNQSSERGRGGAPADQEGQFVATVLAETEATWGRLFQEGGARYEEPTLVLFTNRVNSACGMATSATGPFYCPGDHKLYIDLGFFDELSRRFGAPGDFAQAYVIAHEVGHHVQNLLGILPDVDAQKRRVSRAEANRLSVLVELQADCLAGVWAHDADAQGILDVGDVEEALNAATAIGDDTLQKQSQGYVVPDSFTHGTSAQRVEWFNRGFAQGRVDACDTFSSRI